MPTLERDGLTGLRTGPDPSRRSGAPLVVAGVVTVALVASVLAARYTGAADPLPGGLTDAGPVVRWALPLVRVVHDVAASLTIGSLLLAATMIPGRSRAESVALDEPRRAAAFRVATAAAFVWAIAGAVGVVLTFADAAGMPLSDPSFASNLAGSVWPIETLRVALLSTIAAFVVASVAAVSRARSVAVALTAVSALGLLVLGLAGHAGGSADHETAVNALAAHLLSAAVWVGGLLALILLRGALGESLGVVVRRYSTVALWCFVTLGVSGVMSATTRLGSWSDLATPYGVLILVKVLAFAVLGVAGVWHRRVTLDRIDETGTSGAGAAGTGVAEGARRLRSRLFVRLAVAETLVMALAFGVATALARSEPPVPETVADPSAALSLTGYPAPPAPTAMSWLTAWRVEWF